MKIPHPAHQQQDSFPVTGIARGGVEIAAYRWTREAGVEPRQATLRTYRFPEGFDVGLAMREAALLLEEEFRTPAWALIDGFELH